MWVVIGIVNDRALAGKAKEILLKEGLLVELRPVGKKEAVACEILVLESEAMEAREILAERGII